ncbi:GNAT family N-acetyltransferase [Streptomyces sp. NBC_00250]|uniref:GNAT family N-acetyltransferase n=1 Tax=Streptomyces sp. NBC_00250 TaxID=2903641 RepID=UPI002E28B955|nr:GNAT family N-acetyltransferase [Streptomyces sp. NBC_00250]
MDDTLTPFVVGERSHLGPAGTDESWLDEGGFYSSRRWTVSQEGDRGFDTAYLVGQDEASGRTGGLVPFHTASGGDSNPLYNETTLLGYTPDVQVLAGSRTGYDNRLLIGPGLSEGDRGRLLTALCDRLLDRAEERGAGHVSWWYLPEDEARALAALPGFATVATPCLPTAVVRPRGADFAEHVAALPGSRRSLVRRDLKRLAAAGYRSRSVAADPADLVRYAPLVVQVQARHGEELSEEGAIRYLRRCLSIGGGAEGAASEDVVITEVLDAEDRPAAFALGIVHGRTLHMRVFGCDYAAGHGASGEYFEATVYGPLRLALERGLDAVHLGVTSYRAKSLRGAELHARRTLFMSRSDRRLPVPAPDWGFLGDDERFLAGASSEVLPC